MSKINIKSMEYPVVYEIFGFYVDWKIDNNLFLPGTDPHGINSYDDFLAKEKFQIVEIANENKKMLSIDLVLPKFSFLKIIGIEPTDIIATGVRGDEVERRLNELAEQKGIESFDILSYLA